MKKLFSKIEPRRRKKILIWVAGIMIFMIVLNAGINYWIRTELPAIIKEKNDTAYEFSFDELRFSLLNSSLSIRKITIEPKKNHDKPLPVNLTAKVGEIRVVGVNFIKLLIKKDLNAYSLKINHPDITYYQPEKKDTVPHESELGSAVHISNFEINDGKFRILGEDEQKLAELNGIHIELGGVNLSQRTLEKDIPFLYKSFEIDCDSIYFRLNPSQEMKAGFLKSNNHLFALKNFQIRKTDSKAHNGSYRLLPEIQAPNLSFTGLDWGYDQKDEFYFKAELLKFDSITVDVLDNPDLPDRERDSAGTLIPFRLDIGKLTVDDSRLRIGKAMKIQNINIQIDNIKNNPNQKLSIETILLKNPLVTTYSGQKKSTEKTAENTGFEDHIEIGRIQIKDGQYRVNRLSDNRNLLAINDIDFEIKAIRVTPETFREQIPVAYENLKLSASSLDYNPDPIYSLNTQNINLENGNLNLEQFEMKPKISRAGFVRQLKKEKDLYTISAAKIRVSDMDWGFAGKDLFFRIPNILIENADAHIYRSKIPPDDPKKKLMYSKMLRDLPFILEVQRVDLKDSKLVYEEETENSAGAGKLTFANFNAKIDHIYSGYKKRSLPDVRADIKTNFMNDSRLFAIWTFNPMNRSEKFNIKGSIFNFDARKMTPFVKPYLHATVEGDMQEVRFNFTGNDINATGDFGIRYEDLKVTLYNKDTGKVRKVLSTVGNFLVRSNTREEYNEVRIETVVRNQDRSFFNFFWNCVQQGLKQTVLVI